MSNKLLIEKLATTENINLFLNETYEIPLADIKPKTNETQLVWTFDIVFPVATKKIKIDIEGKKNKGKILNVDDIKKYFILSANKVELCSSENFLGNYYDKTNESKILETFVIDYNINDINQLVTFTSTTIEGIYINSIKITPVREIKSTEIEYKGELTQLESGSNKYIVKIYNKNNEDITKKCTFKWYYYKDKWIQEDNQDTSYGYFTEESPEGLAVQAFIDSHTIEIYKKNNNKIPALNNNRDIYCFVYNKYGTIDSSLLNQEYIIGDLGSLGDSYWYLSDNAIPFGLTNYSNLNTMIKNTWIDSYNRLHFQIKTNYDINSYDNCFTIGEKNYEIFFEQEGDQGVHPDGYSCIIRPCDSKGNLTGSYYTKINMEETYLRAMFFYKGFLQEPNLFKKDSSSYIDISEAEIEVNYDNNFISIEKIPIVFKDNDGNITNNNYITSSFELKNSSKSIVMSIITPMPYNDKDSFKYYPMYIKYSKTGFNPIYITSIEGFTVSEEEKELTSTLPRQFNWNDNFAYPALRFISIDSTVSIEGWNGQSITAGTNNIIDSSQAGVGIVKDNKFTGMVLGVQAKNYGLYGYEDGKETIHLIANGNAKGAKITGTIELPVGTKIKIGDETLEDYINRLISNK